MGSTSFICLPSFASIPRSVNSLLPHRHKPFPDSLFQPIVLYTLGLICLTSPLSLLISLHPLSEHPSFFDTLISSVHRIFDIPPSHSLIHTRSSWRCIAVIKILSRAASQARETACTRQIIHHSRPHTDVALSRLQVTLAVTTSIPPQETLSTQHPWAPPRTLPPFTSITKSKIKNISVLDG